MTWKAVAEELRQALVALDDFTTDVECQCTDDYRCVNCRVKTALEAFDNESSPPPIDEAIGLLERDLVASGRVPGTSITRILPGGPNGRGFGWCLSLGQMHLRKAFFEGNTIEECLDKAIKAFKAVKKGKV